MPPSPFQSFQEILRGFLPEAFPTQAEYAWSQNYRTFSFHGKFNFQEMTEKNVIDEIKFLAEYSWVGPQHLNDDELEQVHLLISAAIMSGLIKQEKIAEWHEAAISNPTPFFETNLYPLTNHIPADTRQIQDHQNQSKVHTQIDTSQEDEETEEQEDQTTSDSLPPPALKTSITDPSFLMKLLTHPMTQVVSIAVAVLGFILLTIGSLGLAGVIGLGLSAGVVLTVSGGVSLVSGVGLFGYKQCKEEGELGLSAQPAV